MSYELYSKVPEERHIYSNEFQSVQKIIRHVQKFRRNDLFIATNFNPFKKIIRHVQEFRRNDIFIATDFNPFKKIIRHVQKFQRNDIFIATNFNPFKKIIRHVQKFRRNDIFIATDFNSLKKLYDTFRRNGTYYNAIFLNALKKHNTFTKLVEPMVLLLLLRRFDRIKIRPYNMGRG